MKRGIIYCYTNKVNGKQYIGQTVTPGVRKAVHLRTALGASCKYPFHLAIKKYGIDNFQYDILEECDEALLNEREVYWITKFDSFNSGYNLTEGAGGIRGYKRTEESKKVMSDKYSNGNHPRCGKTMTEEHKQILRDVHSKRVGVLNHQSKTVIQTNPSTGIIIEYGSTREASRLTGISQSTIVKACKTLKISKGFLWQYKNL